MSEHQIPRSPDPNRLDIPAIPCAQKLYLQAAFSVLTLARSIKDTLRPSHKDPSPALLSTILCEIITL